MKLENNKWYYYHSNGSDTDRFFEAIFQNKETKNECIDYKVWLFYDYNNNELSLRTNSSFVKASNMKETVNANSTNYRGFIQKIFESNILKPI